MQNKHTLESCLFKYCRAGATGTVFITSVSNKACQIVIIEGEITALAFTNKSGMDALEDLKYAEIMNNLYIEDMQFPMTKCASIKSADEVLEYLGYDEQNEFQRAQETEAYEGILAENVIQFEPRKSASHFADRFIAV